MTETGWRHLALLAAACLAASSCGQQASKSPASKWAADSAEDNMSIDRLVDKIEAADRARGAASVDAVRDPLDAYDQLKIGMRYAEAAKVVGSPGKEVAKSNIGGLQTVLYSWQNRAGQGMTATFQNDSLAWKQKHHFSAY